MQEMASVINTPVTTHEQKHQCPVPVRLYTIAFDICRLLIYQK